MPDDLTGESVTLYCVCGEPEHEPNEACPGPDGDLGMCPYYLRYIGAPGADPEGVCMQMGTCTQAEEPQCVTCVPAEGWYSARVYFGGDAQPEPPPVTPPR